MSSQEPMEIDGQEEEVDLTLDQIIPFHGLVAYMESEEFRQMDNKQDQLSIDKKARYMDTYEKYVTSNQILSKVQFRAHDGFGRLVPITPSKPKTMKKREWMELMKGRIGPITYMEKSQRSLLLQNFATEIDIVNCMPTIWLRVCEKFSIPSPVLESYVNNRDVLIAENPGHDLKDIVIKVIHCKRFGQDSPEWIDSQFVRDVHEEFYKNLLVFKEKCHVPLAEFDQVQQKLIKIFNRAASIASTRPKNHPGVVISLFFQEIEKQKIMNLQRKLKASGFSVIGYVYDALFIKTPQNLDDLKTVLRNLKNAPDLTSVTSLRLDLKVSIVKAKKQKKFILAKDQTYDARMLEGTFHYDILFERLRQIFKRIVTPSMFVFINPSGDYKYYKMTDIPMTMTNCQIFKPTKDGWTTVHFSAKFLKDARVDLFNEVNFYPTGIKTPDRHFNTWQGFTPLRKGEAATPKTYTFEGETKSGIEWFKLYIQKLFKTEEEQEFIHKYIAQLVQRPGYRELVPMLVLYSDTQGTGKNTLCAFIAAMTGSRYVFETANLENVLGEFNAKIESKLLVVLNEVMIKKQFKNILKDMVNAPILNINEKFQILRLVRAYHRIIATTNSETPMEVATTDRRTCMFEVSDYFGVNGPGYDLIMFLNKVLVKDPDCGRELLDHYLAFDIPENINLILLRPKTSFMQMNQNRNIDPTLIFIKDFFAHYVDRTSIIKSSNGSVSFFFWGNDFLFMKYMTYAKDRNYRYVDQQTTLVNKVKQYATRGNNKHLDGFMVHRYHNVHGFAVDVTKIDLIVQAIENKLNT